MTVTLRSLVSLLATTGLAAAASWNTTCTSKSQRKAWNNMTDTEKKAYIDAELCLQSTAAKTSIEGAINRWDELDWAHITQSNIIHNTGSFLPWHRYFMRVHEYLLQSECGYEGGQPYWNEVLDMDSLNTSVVFDPDTGFGGDSDGGCVTDGPFVNLTLHINSTSNYAEDCLTRSFNSNGFQTGQQQYIDECFASENYTAAFECYQVNPHTAGHSAVGGTMLDVVGSPGEPLFFLHHTNLDRLWWEWQQVNSSRLTDMGGRNIPLTSYLTQNGMEYPSAALTDYFGDGGNETTLNHNLWMVDIMPNATIREVMDIGGDLICAEYV